MAILQPSKEKAKNRKVVAVLNESFKALVREVFPDKSEGVMKVLSEVINNKASVESLSIHELKNRAIDDIKSEIATRDFVRAEIAEVKTELKSEIAEVRNEIEQVRGEIAKSKSEIIKWVCGFQVACMGVIIALIKLL